MIRNKHVLVAGTGLVGDALIEELLLLGNRVEAISRFSRPGQRKDLDRRGVKTYVADLGTTHPRDIEGLGNKYDAVFHQVALMLEAEDDRPYTWQVNCYSAARLAEHCRDSGSYVVASSGAVYLPTNTPRTETDSLGCINTYGATKIAMEAICTYICESLKIPLALLRYHWPFSLEKGMVAQFAQSISNGDTIQVDRQNRMMVHPTWIGDTIRATIAAAGKASVPAYVVNIAGDDAIEREILITRIAKALRKKPKLEDASLTNASHIAELAKMRADLGRNQVSLDEGIQMVAQHIKKSKTSQEPKP